MQKKVYTFFCLLTILLTVIGASGAKFFGKDQKIQITIGMWPESYLKDDVEMFEEWKRLFERDFPEYEVTGKPYSYSPETFFPMAQSGTTPTIFQTWFTEPPKLIQNGFVKDITAQLKELGWYDKMDPYMMDILSENGKVYGVPRDAYGLGLFINLEILEEVGLVDDWNGDGILDIIDQHGNPRYPTTFEELREMAKYITDFEKDVYGKDVAGLIILSTNRNGGWQFSNIAWNFGANLQIQDENGKWKANLNDPGAVEALEWIKTLRWEDNSLPANALLSYSDWYNYVATGRAAMAFCGNDVIHLPITNFNMDKNYVAFVPMPAGPYGHRYSLMGGTPFMFSSNASDEQIWGALKFLEYMGRSPEVSEVSIQSIQLGMEVARKKGMPILPSLRPWINQDFLEMIERIEKQYINMEMENFKDFFDTFDQVKRKEEPYYTQEMYELLDACIQEVLTNPNADPETLLTNANNIFQKQYLEKIK